MICELHAASAHVAMPIGWEEGNPSWIHHCTLTKQSTQNKTPCHNYSDRLHASHHSLSH